MESATREGRAWDGSVAPSSGAVRAPRHAGTAPRSRNASAITAIPMAMVGPSTEKPGDGSAARAGPIGNTGEAAMAIAPATAAPATLTNATRAIASPNRWRRVIPMAPRTGESVASTKTCRLKA